MPPRHLRDAATDPATVAQLRRRARQLRRDRHPPRHHRRTGRRTIPAGPRRTARPPGRRTARRRGPPGRRRDPGSPRHRPQPRSQRPHIRRGMEQRPRMGRAQGPPPRPRRRQGPAHRGRAEPHTAAPRCPPRVNAAARTDAGSSPRPDGNAATTTSPARPRTRPIRRPKLLGRTEPRLLTPPLRPLNRKTSKGFEVIDFAEMIGEPLLPWQQYAAIHALELLPDGSFRFKTVLILVARQNGKSNLKRIVSLWRMYIDGARNVLGVAQDVSLAREQWTLLPAHHPRLPRPAGRMGPRPQRQRRREILGRGRPVRHQSRQRQGGPRHQQRRGQHRRAARPARLESVGLPVQDHHGPAELPAMGHEQRRRR